MDEFTNICFKSCALFMRLEGLGVKVAKQLFQAMGKVVYGCKTLTGALSITNALDCLAGCSSGIKSPHKTDYVCAIYHGNLVRISIEKDKVIADLKAKLKEMEKEIVELMKEMHGMVEKED